MYQPRHARIERVNVETNATRYAFAAGLLVVLVLLFRVLQRLTSARHGQEWTSGGKNVAYLLVQAGHVAAVLMLVPGIAREALTQGALPSAAAWAGTFAVAGVVLIELVGALGIRLLLGAGLAKELEAGNVAAGVAAAANYVAVGILAAPTLAGSDLAGLALACAFFGIAVLTQTLYVVLFRALTVYDDAEQIHGENLAAAISYAGVSLAVALVLARALTGGEFAGWGPALAGYGGVAVTALALYPVRQVIVGGLVLGRIPVPRGGALDHAIGVDRNAGIAMLEAMAYLATAVALVQLA